tara:strand:+ start:6939 stop:7280 length:342 start_codon:yes stop_codon:yes gene_type:complete
MMMAKWLMNLSVTKDGKEKTVSVRADSFVDLLEEYTQILRNNCIHEDDVNGPLESRGIQTMTPEAKTFIENNLTEVLEILRPLDVGMMTKAYHLLWQVEAVLTDEGLIHTTED